MLPGLNRVLVYDPIDDYKSIGTYFTTPGALCDFFVKNDKLDYCVRFISDDRSLFDVVCRLVYSIQCVHFVIEEISLYCDSNPYSVPHYLDKIIRFGRRWDQVLISTSQRPADIPKILMSQSSKIVSFRQHQKRDLDALSDYFPGDRLMALAQFKYLVYSDNSNDFLAGSVFPP